MYELALIIPVYNNVQALPKLLASLLPQIDERVQCLFIDDGSDDESYAFLCQETQFHPTIEVFTQSNRGVAATRNRGYALSKSRYVWFIDGDDWITADAIEVVLTHLQTTTAPMIHFNFHNHFLNGVEQENHYFLQGQHAYKGEAFYRQAIEDFQYELKNMVWSFLFERRFLEQNQLVFDEELPIFEDILFLAQCYQTNAQLEILPKSLYHYQQHQASLTHTVENLREAKYHAIIEKLSMLHYEQEQTQKAVSKYCLLLVSQGLSAENSQLLADVLIQNKHLFWAKYQTSYRLYWRWKVRANRLMRKIFRIPMAWK